MENLTMNLNLLSLGSAGGGSMWTLIIIYALIFCLVSIFILIRPKSKKSKQEQELRNGLQILVMKSQQSVVSLVELLLLEKKLMKSYLKQVLKRQRWYLSVGLFQLLIQDKDKPAEKTDKTEKKGFFGRKKKNAEENPVEK